MSFVKMFQGKIPAKDIGGPILIAQAAGQQARLGFEYLLHFMAVISVNLGVLNLLPIPVLDGGHFLFFALEAILRRPLDIRHREIAQQVGLVVLICADGVCLLQRHCSRPARVGLAGARPRRRHRDLEGKRRARQRRDSRRRAIAADHRQPRGIAAAADR